jgi:hypothetical protein
MEGQMGSFYFDENGNVGHFSYLGDETWTLIPNIVAEPYSPLELYVMGLIPPEEVPPIHILSAPDTTDPEAIKAGSYDTVTIEEIMAVEGGERNPPWTESQKDFTMAFIVSQDRPYDDAAYAFFSLMSYQLTSLDPPSEYKSHLAPFHWATGGRATLETALPLDLAIPVMPGQPVEEVAAEDVEEESVAASSESTDDEAAQDGGLPTCNLMPVGIMLIVPAWLGIRKKGKDYRKNDA